MTDPRRRGDAPHTCWSCQGTGQRFIGSSGRLHKQPCPVCAGIGTSKTAKGTSLGMDWRPGWLRALMALI